MIYLSGQAAPPTNLSYQQRVKETNIKRIFDLLRSGSCESRAELVRMMELSATSVSVLVEELQKRGLIAETGPKPTTLPGRRPIRLEFNTNSRQIAVLSPSRRGIRFSLLNLRCEQLESFFVEFASSDCKDPDPGTCYARKFEEILREKSLLFDPQRVMCIGITIPGIYQPEAQVFSMSTSISLSFSKASMLALERRMGIPLFFENASVCRAYSEKKLLDSQSNDSAEGRDLLYVNISDGVGAAIIYDGDIITGTYHTAGEIGHMTIDYQGIPCPCGSRGCLERYVNQNAILTLAQERCAAEGIPGPESFAELCSAYRKAAPVQAVLQQTAERLASGIYNMVCATGIQNIILGGGIEELGDEFRNQVFNCLRQSGSILCSHLSITYAQAGSNADSTGFAHYYLDKTYTITY